MRYYNKQLVWHLVALLVIGYFLFVYKTGERDIWSPDEDEYALVNREMVRDGNWVFPTANGKPYSIKPPLFNWIGSLISLLDGEVTEFTCRIPSAIAGLAGVIALYLLGLILFNPRAGFLSALVLGTTFLYIQFARWIQINMLATLFLILTLLLFYRGYLNEDKRRWTYLLMYVSMGLGTLTMGPVNVVMPAIVIFFYLLLIKDLKHIRQLKIGWGLVIYLAIVAPWYFAVSLKGSYGGNILITTNITRYFTSWGHVRPFYYYLVNLPGNFLPWTLFLPGALFLLFSEKCPEERKKLLFPAVWVVSLFVFFSLSQAKRSEYILPVFPGLALLLGRFFDASIERWRTARRWRRSVVWPSYTLMALLFLSGLGLPIYSFLKSPDWLGTVIPFSLLIFGSAVVLFILIQKERVFLEFVTIGLFISILTVYAAGPIVSKANPHNSTKSFCTKVAGFVEEGTTLKMYGYYRPAYAFYTGRFVEKTDSVATLSQWLTSEKPQYVVMQKRDYMKIKGLVSVDLHIIDEWEGYRNMVLVSNRAQS
jgi:4-amino-4-deoxy-L-arabinose transferase-like glycosyltransferase